MTQKPFNYVGNGRNWEKLSSIIDYKRLMLMLNTCRTVLKLINISISCRTVPQYTKPSNPGRLELQEDRIDFSVATAPHRAKMNATCLVWSKTYVGNLSERARNSARTPSVNIKSRLTERDNSFAAVLHYTKSENPWRWLLLSIPYWVIGQQQRYIEPWLSRCMGVWRTT